MRTNAHGTEQTDRQTTKGGPARGVLYIILVLGSVVLKGSSASCNSLDEVLALCGENKTHRAGVDIYDDEYVRSIARSA